MSRIIILLILASSALLTACAGGTDANIPGPSLPVVVAQPADATVLEGTPATFSVGAAGAGALGYQWQFSTDGVTWTNIVGATGAAYTTGPVTVSMNGNRYRAVITNALGSTTTSAVRLTVTPSVIAPQITVQPANQTVTAPNTATFNVTATGTSPGFQWQVSTDGGTTWSDVAGATTATLTLANTTTTQNGNRYRVRVSNSAGTVTSTAATLTVNPTPVAPAITTQPANRTITAGANADFIVAASGTPAPGYQWRLGTVNLANGAIGSGGCAGATVAGATTATLTLTTVPIGCSGSTFSVVVSNGVAPDATSSAATLTVNPAPVAPAITTQPATEAVVTAGQTAQFTAAASGVPGPTLQWQLSTDGGGSYSNITGANGGTYTTPATVLADEGRRYRLVATNGSGTATSGAGVLYVYGAPSVSNPADASVIAAQTATFSVTVSGAQGPAALQWQRAEAATPTTFVDIAGATGVSYTTPATVAGDNNARFRVRWSNASNDPAPAAISNAGNTNAATLTVANPLTATQVIAGFEWSLALRPDRTVWGWGQYHRNDGTVQYSNLAPANAQRRPQQMYPTVLTDIRQIAGVLASFWAIKGAPGTTQSRLLHWGRSLNGQDGRGVDGNGTAATNNWGPERVNEVAPVEALLGVGQPVDRLCSIAAGLQALLIIRAVDDGGLTTDCNPGSAKTVWFIGSLTQFASNATGLVERMPGLPTNSPPAAIFAGQTLSGTPPIAIALEDGRAYALGTNPFNGLGLALPAAGTAGGMGGPVQLPGTWGAPRSFGMSFYYSLFVVRADGSVRTSGYNQSDELGIGDTASGFRVDGPVDVLAESCTQTTCTTPLTGITSLASNNSLTTLGVKNGQIIGWGSPVNGMLGAGYVPGQTQAFPRLLPFSLDQVTAVSTSYNHALAIGAGNAVYAWGSGLRGALGDGIDGSSRTTPQFVTLP
jgi:alpha-tubulin suppressor-like RCC1 family protein